MKPRTDEELKEIITGILDGLIFTDRQVQSPELIMNVFMPLVFMDKEQVDKLKADNPKLLFEYISKAGPRSINGMPMFMSLAYIPQSEWDRFTTLYNQIKAVRE